jgi:outer membrane protein OmpA-like peptidoglycan-associated protein
MMKAPRILPAVLFSSLLMISSAARGQTVNDLRGQPVTAEKLISVLTPKESRPAAVRSATRGISLVAPSCTKFRKAAARGIALRPKSDIAAITVEFESGSARLTASDDKILKSLGEALQSETLKPCCFEIEGHTDSVGKPAYNQRLSQRRAQAVVEYLAEHNSIDHDRMIARGFGMSEPIASNDTAEGRAKNRRVQIVNLGYGSDLAD